MQTIAVRTTQNVFIHYPVASAGERILGYLIDRLIMVVYSFAIVGILARLEVKAIWVWVGLLAPVWFLFSVLFEIFMNGQTPGKRLMRLQVVRLSGTQATVGDFVIRWIFGFIDFFILGGAIAVIIVAAGGKGQRLGDVVAGTSVIKLSERKEIAASEIFITADDQYTPAFAQVVQLNSTDIELMQRALEAERNFGNSAPLLAVAAKIRAQLGIQTDLPPEVLIPTLIKDFSHLTSR